MVGGKRRIRVTQILLLFLLGLIISPLRAGENNYSTQLPAFSLQDPAGKIFTQKDFAHGIVLVVTAPILANESYQRGWSDILVKTKGTSKARVVFVEDMTPSYFKKIALNSMKKEYEPGKDPILLIDHDGELRKNLRVEEKKTIVLVYNKNGKLIYSETGRPSDERARAIWHKIL